MPWTPRLPRFAATLTLLALILAALSLNDALIPAAQAQTTTTVDYDRNDDGLIEITNLAQLNTIRWDLNGDGAVAATDQTNYAAAFPNAATGMGCPDGGDADTNPDPCIGYELKSDLTFDTNGDGSVTAADSGGLYWNGGAGWTPIGDVYHDHFTGEFQGRGKVISHLFINNSAATYLGLFGAIGQYGRVSGVGLEQVSISISVPPIAGGLVRSNAGTITASYATGTVSGHVRSGAHNAVAGGLAGLNAGGGTVRASFATAAVSVRHSNAWAVAGGLAGINHGHIQASYATGAVSVHGNTRRTWAGGLVGSNEGPITASYARGRVTASGSGIAGGLAGRSFRNGRATASYWDTDTSGLTASAGGTGQSSSALQTPAGYTGIYANWNLNLDSVAGGDTPWNFGGDYQYPILAYGTLQTAPQRDYDADNDQLLEVNNLEQLNAIRWDLNTDGVVAAVDQDNYAAAFPGPVAGMGCANGTTAAACTGYELQADLDFDTNGSGSIDANDQFWNNGQGWQAIGGFSDAPPQSATKAIGLFEMVGPSGVIDSVKLRDVNIRTRSRSGIGALAGASVGTITGSSATGRISVNLTNAGTSVRISKGTSALVVADAGGLVASNYGNITGSYANTEISGNARVAGGLVGSNSCFAYDFLSCGSIVASYSVGAISTTYNSRDIEVGGLVGENGSGAITAVYSFSPVKAIGNKAKVGGLVGYNTTSFGPTILSDGTIKNFPPDEGTITASYAVGPVVATGANSFVGGLVGKNDRGTAVNSYWATGVSGQNSSALGTGKTW